MALGLGAAALAQSGPLVAVARAAPASDKDEIYRLLDDLRVAVRNDDWAEGWRLAARLNWAVISRRDSTGQVSPDLELSHVEMMAGRDATTRSPLLPRLAKAAFNAHQYAKAEGYAKEALDAAARGSSFWWAGDAIHQGNIVLGRLALQRGESQAAGQFLLAAGKTPGSAVLGSLGPNMGLARDLLQRGQREVVEQYLEACKGFWKADRGKLAEWLALVRAGITPNFGANVDY